MTKKIFRSIFLTAALVLLVCVVLVFGVLYEYYTAVQEKQLDAQVALAAQGAEKEGLSYFDGLNTGDYRLTWVAADGSVLYDSKDDASAMENHASREEIREALENGTGHSTRVSATRAEKTIYSAVRMDDGTVMRASVTQYTVMTLVLGMLQPIVVVVAVAFVLSAVLAGRISKRITGPLNSLDLDRPLENDTYEELTPILTRLEAQHRRIESQMDELQRKNDEFSAVTSGMSDGLVLVGEKGEVLSINPAAERIFAADADSVGKDILTVSRSPQMRELIDAAADGRRAEGVVGLNGGEYQINASPVLSAGKTIGVALLAFDVTGKAAAERQRREFTANVSHELKTPLQSIMGSAELIGGGLVKKEDMPRFVDHIRSEASRLLALIDDIIRLSQLDEGVPLPEEDTELTAVASEAAAALASAAKERGVTLEVRGDKAVVHGVRRLLYEMVYNLCDNAVKYNVEGGRADVTVKREDGGAVLTVSDTGIGIPPEHQAHVFERFYRVDKSHSKATGGTGLGLSIVKHAAQYHGASVELRSVPGKGTTVTVRFPPSAAEKTE